MLPGLADRVFLTIGRQDLAAFAHLTGIWFLYRMVEAPMPVRRDRPAFCCSTVARSPSRASAT